MVFEEWLKAGFEIRATLALDERKKKPFTNSFGQLSFTVDVFSNATKSVVFQSRGWRASSTGMEIIPPSVMIRSKKGGQKEFRTAVILSTTLETLFIEQIQEQLNLSDERVYG